MSRSKNGRRKSSDYRYWEMIERQRQRWAERYYWPSDLDYVLVGPVSGKKSAIRSGGVVWAGHTEEPK